MGNWSTWYHENTQTMLRITCAFVVFLLVLRAQVYGLQESAIKEMFSAFQRDHLDSTKEPNLLSINLMHVQHIDSPYARLNLTLTERVGILLESSKKRWSHSSNQIYGKDVAFGMDHSNSFPVYSTNQGGYVIQIVVGTPRRQRPPQLFHIMMDTALDFIWLQCFPCYRCYQQEDGLYQPAHSSTYHMFSCQEAFCRDFPPNLMKCSSINTCVYTVKNTGGAYSKGDLVRDTFTFNHDTQPVFRTVGFGCGHENKEPAKRTAGLLGLGRSRPSLTSQMGVSLFSYCLVDLFSARTKKSPLILGGTPEHLRMDYTPMFPNPVYASGYVVKLQGISVANRRIPWPQGNAPNQHAELLDLLVDSGTTATFLIPTIYSSFKDAVSSHISYPPGSGALINADLCYDLTHVPPPYSQFPSVVFHLETLDVYLPGKNVFLELDESNRIVCLILLPRKAHSTLNIFGNYQQQGFQVTHDIPNNRMGFAPNSC